MGPWRRVLCVWVGRAPADSAKLLIADAVGAAESEDTPPSELEGWLLTPEAQKGIPSDFCLHSAQEEFLCFLALGMVFNRPGNMSLIVSL